MSLLERDGEDTGECEVRLRLASGYETSSSMVIGDQEGSWPCRCQTGCGVDSRVEEDADADGSLDRLGHFGLGVSRFGLHRPGSSWRSVLSSPRFLNSAPSILVYEGATGEVDEAVIIDCRR